VLYFKNNDIMKTTMLIALGLMTASSLRAQKLKEADVPTAVKEAFRKSYPLAKQITWEHESPNYEAGFKIEKTEYSAVYDSSGNLIETETGIRVDQLPATARTYIAKTYPNARISEAAKITDANKVVSYEAELKGKDLIFDSTGAFVKELAK